MIRKLKKDLIIQLLLSASFSFIDHTSVMHCMSQNRSHSSTRAFPFSNQGFPHWRKSIWELSYFDGSVLSSRSPPWESGPCLSPSVADHPKRGRSSDITVVLTDNMDPVCNWEPTRSIFDSPRRSSLCTWDVYFGRLWKEKASFISQGTPEIYLSREKRSYGIESRY